VTQQPQVPAPSRTDPPDAATEHDVDDAEPASEPLEAAADNGIPAGMPSSGEGWSAVFPGRLEPFVDEVPLPELDITLSNGSTRWEAGEETLAVMVAQMPVDETSPALIDESRAQFFSTAAGTGTIIEDSPLLDGEGRFRGRDAVVFTEATTLYQVLHLSSANDGGAALRAFVEGLTIGG